MPELLDLIDGLDISTSCAQLPGAKSLLLFASSSAGPLVEFRRHFPADPSYDNTYIALVSDVLTWTADLVTATEIIGYLFDPYRLVELVRHNAMVIFGQ